MAQACLFEGGLDACDKSKWPTTFVINQELPVATEQKKEKQKRLRKHSTKQTEAINHWHQVSLSLLALGQNADLSLTAAAL